MGTCHRIVRSSTTRCTTLSTCLAYLWFLLSPHLLSIQHQLLCRGIILILDRLMWEDMVSTRIPTATWSRRWFSRISEPYTETTCYTQNKESCVTKPINNCTGVIETNVERVCFDVNELVCDLVEAIHYETLEETYQVQRCFTGKDRVCDTTYKIDMTTKDDHQCTNVETPNCYMEEKVINDVTCTNSVEFNCKRDKSTKNDGYGPKGVVCARKPTQNCYNIPRKI